MIKQVFTAVGMAAALVSSTAAFAGEATRSVAALPSAQSVLTAPSARQGQSLRNKDHLAGGGIIVAILAVVAVGAGIAVVASDSNG